MVTKNTPVQILLRMLLNTSKLGWRALVVVVPVVGAGLWALIGLFRHVDFDDSSINNADFLSDGVTPSYENAGHGQWSLYYSDSKKH